MHPLVHYWRSHGLKAVVYLENGLCAENGKQPACAASQLVFQTIEQAGFAVHPVKSVQEPTQRLVWLGIIIDMALGQTEVPQCKIAAVCGMRVSAKPPKSKPNAWTVFQENYVNESRVWGSEPFYDSYFYAVLESRQTRHESIQLSPEVPSALIRGHSIGHSRALDFWSSNFKVYNPQPIWQSPSAVRVVYSDAGETGCGGHVTVHGPCFSHGCWPLEEAARSSTRWELSAVYMVLSMAPMLGNARGCWFSDTQNVALFHR